MPIFKAKKEIPQSKIDTTSDAVVITSPIKEPFSLPPTVNFQIEGIAPIELTDAEYKQLQIILIKIAGRVSNLKDVTKSINEDIS